MHIMKKGAIIISIFFLALGFMAMPAKSQAAWGVGVNLNYNNGFGNNGWGGNGYSPYGYGYGYGSGYNGTWNNNPYTNPYGGGYGGYGNNGFRIGVNFGFGNGGYGGYGGYPCMPTNGWGC
jgi:hypothetical protein